MSRWFPRPSDWLETNVHPRLIYGEEKLRELSVVGIKYDGGLLMSMRWDKTAEAPYPTYSRHASVRMLTPRQAVAMGARLSPQAHDRQYVLGYDIAAAVWQVLHPITVDGPPSRIEDDPDMKMRRDVASLRRYGY